MDKECLPTVFSLSWVCHTPSLVLCGTMAPPRTNDGVQWTNDSIWRTNDRVNHDRPTLLIHPVLVGLFSPWLCGSFEDVRVAIICLSLHFCVSTPLKWKELGKKILLHKLTSCEGGPVNNVETRQGCGKVVEKKRQVGYPISVAVHILL